MGKKFLPGKFQWYFRKFERSLRKFKECLKKVSRVFQDRFNGVSRKIDARKISVVFKGI